MSKRSRWLMIQRPMKRLAARAIKEASAAPVMPISGKIQMPKMKKGSRTALATADMIMIIAGVRVSPVARMALLPTMGMMTNGTPMYQSTMY